MFLIIAVICVQCRLRKLEIYLCVIMQQTFLFFPICPVFCMEICYSDFQYIFLSVWLYLCLFAFFLICQSFRSYWQFVFVLHENKANWDMFNFLLERKPTDFLYKNISLRHQAKCNFFFGIKSIPLWLKPIKRGGIPWHWWYHGTYIR